MVHLKDTLDKKLKEIYTGPDENGYFLKPTEWANQKNDRDNSVDAHYCATKCLELLNTIFARKRKFTCVQNFTNIVNNYGCYNLQLILDNLEESYSHSICINISPSIPFFHIHVLVLNRQPTNFPKWKDFPKRDKHLEKITYSTEISTIKDLLIEDLGLHEMPEALIETVIPWLFTEDIHQGEFTYYQAFFQREFYTR